MGCSMALADPALEPADTVFDHPKSKRRYQVTRKEGELWHREMLLTSGSEEVVLSEYPVKYSVGSGRHGRTYLVEAEGFLVESPVSWYAARKEWGVSPGYDRPDHSSFQRGVGESCLNCHAGQAETVDNSQQRVRIKELAIGCERCHGPGSLHMVEHTSGQNGAKKATGTIDHTIVNPSHLSRDLAEAICQQCHFTGMTAVLVRERGFSDYRPALPLEDFRQVYVLAVDKTPMTVVGHVEQLHMSRCYKESGTLTCTTCHAPHAMPRPQEREAHYRTVCLSCHQPQACKVDHERQLRESPTNNCVQCHMPNAATEVPHVAFAHHRIAVHEKLEAERAEQGRLSGRAGVLQPFLDDSRFSEIDKKRSLGLAYLSLSPEQTNPEMAALYGSRAAQLLSAVHVAGLLDPAVEAYLTRQSFDRGKDEALWLAKSTLALPGIRGSERSAPLFVLGAESLRRKQYKEALAAFRELVTLRRHPHDWFFLGDCQKALGNQTAYVQALEMAVRIDPRMVQVHQILAQYYRQHGDAQRAHWHEVRAVP
jgi:predicted CXXCH cytochrome family protein